MLNLLSVEFYVILPFLFFAIFIGVAAIIITAAVKSARAKQSYKNYSATHSLDTVQRRAESGKNSANSQTPRGASDDLTAHGDHAHVGEDTEQYEKIVGSLGEIDDEGCDELDGVRLIAHDLVYEPDEETKDYSEAIKAMVLGDILNTPRCKGAYRKK